MLYNTDGAKITFLRVTKKMLPLPRQTIKHEPDKVWATIDLATLGVGKTFKLFEKAGGPVFRKAADVAEDVGYALNIRSWFMTTKNKWKKRK